MFSLQRRRRAVAVHVTEGRILLGSPGYDQGQLVRSRDHQIQHKVERCLAIPAACERVSIAELLPGNKRIQLGFGAADSKHQFCSCFMAINGHNKVPQDDSHQIKESQKVSEYSPGMHVKESELMTPTRKGMNFHGLLTLSSRLVDPPLRLAWAGRAYLILSRS